MGAEPIDKPADLPGNPDPVKRASPGRMKLAETLVALGVVALGVVVLIGTQDITVPKALTLVGPRNIPTAVGVGLVLVGIWYAVDVLRGDVAEPAADSEDADPTLPADWGVLARLAAVLVVYAFIMKPAGFIIASAVLFSGTAYALGSRHFVRDVPIGVALAIAAWFLFSEWLGIRLPAGLLDGIL